METHAEWLERTIARNRAEAEAREARQLTGVRIGERESVCALIGPWREGETIRTVCGRTAKHQWEVASYDDGISCARCLSRPWGTVPATPGETDE